MRSSFSNGFRAPALQQSQFSTTSTVILTVNRVTGPVEVKTFRVADPAAAALGATPLTIEKSASFSGGFTVGPADGLSASVDYYNIFIADRIVLSSNFSNGSVSAYLASRGYPGLAGGRYFANAIDSRTEGVDVTARYASRLFRRDTISLTAAYNLNRATVTHLRPTPAAVLALTGGTPIFDRQSMLRFERGTPADKLALSAAYELGRRFRGMVRGVRYGEVLVAGTTAATDQVLSPAWVTDLELGWRCSRRVSVAVGGNNVFGTYPDRLNAANNSTGLSRYSNFSPFGFNGGFYYTRLDLEY